MSINLAISSCKDTKQILLETAFKVFMLNEFGKVTFGVLERATFYTRGIFFYYFQNKTTLFTQLIDTYFFSSLNPDHPIFTSEIKSFDDYLKRKAGHQTDVWEWFKKKNINENPVLSMHHLLIQASLYYPQFNSKYEKFVQAQNHDWFQAISIGKQNGEIAEHCDSESLATLLAVFFKKRPLSGGKSTTYKQAKQFCLDIGILKQ